MYIFITTFLIAALLTGPCYSQIERDIVSELYGHCSRISYAIHYKVQDSIIARIDTNKINTAKYWDPLDAFGLAVIPGVIVRGAGHWYAKRYLTGTALFIASVIGLKLYISAQDPSGWEGYRDGHPIWHENKYYKLQRYSGLFIWFGTWAYDLIGAPIICIHHNRQVKAALSVRPCLMKNRDGASAGIQFSYSF